LSTASGTSTPGNHTVYGRIPARQNAFVGTYTDAVTVTVTYEGRKGLFYRRSPLRMKTDLRPHLHPGLEARDPVKG
jgi:hypothetical protein